MRHARSRPNHPATELKEARDERGQPAGQGAGGFAIRDARTFEVEGRCENGDEQPTTPVTRSCTAA
jgi:hypothetical protein